MSAQALHCISTLVRSRVAQRSKKSRLVSHPLRAIPGDCCMCGEPPLRDFCPHGAFSYSGRTRYNVSISFHLQVAVLIGPPGVGRRPVGPGSSALLNAGLTLGVHACACYVPRIFQSSTRPPLRVIKYTLYTASGF